MTQKALVIDDVAVNVCATADLATNFHPDLAADFVDVPDDVVVGSTYNGSTWDPPEDPLVYDPSIATNAQRKAHKLAQIETNRIARMSVGITINGFTGPTSPDQFDRMGRVATGVNSNVSITTVSWDRVTGFFESFDRDLFLFAFNNEAGDVQDVNEQAAILAAAAIAVDDTQAAGDYQDDLDAIDDSFTPPTDPFDPSTGVYGDWPTYRFLTFP